MNKKFKNYIFYEIYPVSFKDSNGDGLGDIPGIISKLDYVKDMGFNAVWFNPFFKTPFRDGGYDISDFFDIDPMFGNMADFENLVRECHKRDLKVVLDLVAGHASNENPLFLKSAEATRNEYSDMFIWTPCVWNYPPNYKLVSGLYPRDGNYQINFFEFQPAFNYGYNHVEFPEWQMSYKDERTNQAKDYLLSIMRFWLNKGADGFRVDMASSLIKNDPEKEATIELWNEFFASIRKEYPEAFFVAEWGYSPQSFKAGFDADFVLINDESFMNALVRNEAYGENDKPVLMGGSTDNFINDMRMRFDTMKQYDSKLAIISGNHDTPRIADQLDDKALRSFYLFQMTSPGIPFIYQGDEIGMKTSKVPTKDGGYNRTGARTPVQWNNSKNYGFSLTDGETYLPTGLANGNTIEEQNKNPDSLLNYIKKLIKLRKETPELTDDKFDICFENKILKIKRDKMVYILNLSEQILEFYSKDVLFSSEGHNRIEKYESILIKN